MANNKNPNLQCNETLKKRWQDLTRFVRRSNAVNYLLAFPSMVLLYSFIVFSFALGNALSDQQRWSDFRNEALLTDLARTYPNHDDISNVLIQLRGNIGLSAVAAHVAKEYPITEEIIQARGLGGDYFIEMYRLRHYYGTGYDYSLLWNTDEWDYSSWEVAVDSYYHIIRDGGDGRMHVVLK